MDHEFWISSWKEGGFRTSFHRSDVHPFVHKHLPPDVLSGKHVFVPLCGKSADMIYFAKYAASVTGVELSRIAVEQFSQENALDFIEVGNVWQAENITIHCRDIFSMSPDSMPEPDIIYDRAALVALPQKIRVAYVDLITRFAKRQTSYYLNTLEYTPTQKQPPFSISQDDVTAYFEKHFYIDCLEAEDIPDHGLIRAWKLNFVVENLYRLTPLSCSQ